MKQISRASAFYMATLCFTVAAFSLNPSLAGTINEGQNYTDTPPPADPTVPCVQSFSTDVSLSILRGKISLSEPATFEMLANPNKPNEFERAAISRFAEKLDSCRRLGSKFRAASYSPDGILLIDQYFAGMRARLVDLFGGVISFGEYNKLKEAGEIKLQADATALQQKNKVARQAQFKEQVQAEREAEAIRQANENDTRQRRAAAFMEAGRILLRPQPPLQPVPSAPRSTQTMCQTDRWGDLKCGNY